MLIHFVTLWKHFKIRFSCGFWEICKTVFNTSTKILGMRIIKDLNSTRQLGNISLAHMVQHHAKMFPTDPNLLHTYIFTKIPTNFVSVLETLGSVKNKCKVCFALDFGFRILFVFCFWSTFQTSKCPPVHFSCDISWFRESPKYVDAWPRTPRWRYSYLGAPLFQFVLLFLFFFFFWRWMQLQS